MARSLPEAKDLEGEWSINVGPPEGGLPASGVITEAERDLLPQIEVCETAPQASKEAIKSLEWTAFRQLDKNVEDPIDMPEDREGHIIFVQEFLMTDEPAALMSLFDAVSPAFSDCVGPLPAGEEGAGTVSLVDIELLGDQRIAALATIEEAGGGGTWYVYSVLVRKGSVLASFTIADVVLGDLEAEVDVDVVAEIVSRGLAQL